MIINLINAKFRNVFIINVFNLILNPFFIFQHANCVRCKVVELLEQIAAGLTKQKPPPFSVPDKDLPLRSDVQPGTWFARDNVYNFIKFCRLVGMYI